MSDLVYWHRPSLSLLDWSEIFSFHVLSKGSRLGQHVTASEHTLLLTGTFLVFLLWFFFFFHLTGDSKGHKACTLRFVFEPYLPHTDIFSVMTDHSAAHYCYRLKKDRCLPWQSALWQRATVFMIVLILAAPPLSPFWLLLPPYYSLSLSCSLTQQLVSL